MSAHAERTSKRHGTDGVGILKNVAKDKLAAVIIVIAKENPSGRNTHYAPFLIITNLLPPEE